MIAAISGAHTIGTAKLENSKYKGTWTVNPDVFDNDYYKQLILRGWAPDWAVNGNPKKN